MKALSRLFIIAACIVGFSTAVHAHNDKGLITKSSKYSATETLDRLENVLKSKGITVMLRWSHDKGARAVGMKLRPTELLIFGNPRMGTHLLTSNQTAAIDLPLKALVWKDEKGRVWLTYNDPDYIADRHTINDRKKIINKMRRVLNKLTNIATGNI